MDDSELTSSGLSPNFARSLFVSEIDNTSPAPPSGIGDGDLVGFEIIGAGGGFVEIDGAGGGFEEIIGAGGGSIISTTSEPE